MDSLANLIETFATNELVKLAIPMAVGALIIKMCIRDRS